MPIFHFDLHECGSVATDDDGKPLADLAAARRDAVAAARDVMAAEVREGRLCMSCHIEIRAPSGEILDTVRFGDAVAISGI